LQGQAEGTAQSLKVTEQMAILYKNGDLTINVSRIDVLRISPMERTKVEVYLGDLTEVLSCSNEEDAKKIYKDIYSLMLQV